MLSLAFFEASRPFAEETIAEQRSDDDKPELRFSGRRSVSEANDRLAACGSRKGRRYKLGCLNRHR
jgi:hypothetical protein